MKFYSRDFISRKLQQIINASGSCVSLSNCKIIVDFCVRTSYGSLDDLMTDLSSHVIFYENNF